MSQQTAELFNVLHQVTSKLLQIFCEEQHSELPEFVFAIMLLQFTISFSWGNCTFCSASTLHFYPSFLSAEGRSAGTTPKWQELCHCIRLLLALHAFVLMTASWLVWWSGVTVLAAASLFSTSVCTVYTTTETLLFVANSVPIVLYQHQQKIQHYYESTIT